MRWVPCGLILFLFPALGCYYVRQAGGQIDILLSRKDLKSVLASHSLPPQKESNLRRVLDAKDFAEHELGLHRTDHYTTYYDVRQAHISYIVSACARTSFTPYVWSFPIVGDLPYKGFFDLADARAEAEELRRAGFDVSVRPVGAYSTLGWFSDPVLSTMLELPEDSLVALVIHELTHSTLFLEGRADFNESLADFVAIQGTLRFFYIRDGPQSAAYRRAVARFADRARFTEFLESLYRKLNSLYTSAASADEKLLGRKEIVRAARREFRSIRKTMRTGAYGYVEGMEWNNADILAERRYLNVQPFYELFTEVGGSWPRFWERLRSIQ